MKIRSVLLGAACILVFTACKSSASAPAASGGNDTASTSVSPSVSPSADPMATARLEGTYDVIKKVVSQMNFSDIKKGQTFKRTYEVTLDCATGPCDGSVRIDADESKGTITQDVVWDAATHTYSFSAKLAPATCPGIDGKTYKLATTSSFVLTPTHLDTVDVAPVVTKFTAIGKLKAVANGAAKSHGHCGTSTATYSYKGVHQ